MTKPERIQFRVSKEEKDFIRKQCTKEDITISEFMTRALFLLYDNIKEAE